MRILRRLLIAIVALTAGGLLRADVEEDKQQLLDLEKHCAEALVHVDIPFLASFYANGWILVGSDGSRYSRQQTLAFLSLGKVKWESCVYNDMEARVFGNTAFVVYKATAAGEVDGGRIEETEVCADTFIREGDRWRCVHSHNRRME
jgi:ketosteroid isomerase-like protein